MNSANKRACLINLVDAFSERKAKDFFPRPAERRLRREAHHTLAKPEYDVPIPCGASPPPYTGGERAPRMAHERGKSTGGERTPCRSSRDDIHGAGAVLCTLIEAHFHFDWQLGASALFFEDGLNFSGFGDPALDAAAISAAKEAFAARASVLLHIRDQSDQSPAQRPAVQASPPPGIEGMPPSAAVPRAPETYSILAEYFTKDSEQLAAYSLAAESLKKGGRVLFVKELDARVGETRVRTALFGEDGAHIGGGAVSCERDALAAAVTSGRFQYNEEKRILIDPVFPEEPLLILGGGGLDAAISDLAARAGFTVTLVSDPEKFPQAICDFRFGAASSVLVASRSYYDDYACLQALAGRVFRYAGCLGSARKSQLLFEELRHAGWTDGMLARLHAPVGLPIGAFAPEELAISIVAELIAVRRGAAAYL